MKIDLSNNDLRIQAVDQNDNTVHYKLHYLLNQYSSEYGSVALKSTKDGSISNCYILSINSTDESYLYLYINKNTLQIQHIDFIKISTIYALNKKIAFPIAYYNYRVVNKKYKKLNLSNEFETYSLEAKPSISHDIDNNLLVTFGDYERALNIASDIQILLDNNSCLSGIFIKSNSYTKKLIERFN